MTGGNTFYIRKNLINSVSNYSWFTFTIIIIIIIIIVAVVVAEFATTHWYDHPRISRTYQ